MSSFQYIVFLSADVDLHDCVVQRRGGGDCFGVTVRVVWCLVFGV